jgi:hypothetical protein
MNTDDSRLIARFQRLTIELLAQKRLGHWHPELVDELYRTSLELEQRGLKKSPEYRNAMSRVHQQAGWLAESVQGSAVRESTKHQLAIKPTR